MSLETAHSADDEIISLEDIEILFGRLEEVKNLSKRLLVKLNSQVKPTTSGVGLAAIFLELSKDIQHVYSMYAINFPKIVSVYQKAQQNPRFVEFEKVCEANQHASLLTLGDLFIMPIQRIPRYRLLFEVRKSFFSNFFLQFNTFDQGIKIFNTRRLYRLSNYLCC